MIDLEEKWVSYFESGIFSNSLIQEESSNNYPLDLKQVNKNFDGKLKFPNKVIYTKWKETIYEQKYLCINIPQEYFLEHYIKKAMLYFNSKEEMWFSSHKSIKVLQRMIDNVAKNGFNHPLCFALNNLGQLYPLSCNSRLLIARYLNLPSIPAVILIDNIKVPDGTIDCKNRVTKYLSPYLVI